jgi:SAM-dependent methyltransferase
MESRRSYAGVRDDHAFFLAHTDQTERLSMAVAERLASLPEGARILDYGCGRGAFLEAVLERLGWREARLTLVEPDAAFLSEAARRLSRFEVVSAPRVLDGPQDVVLAAQVLYYVKDLRATLEKLLAPGGKVMVALGGRAKVTTQLRRSAYQMLGMSFPFYLAEDVERVLTESPWRWSSQKVPSTLAFPDSKENRLSLLRFLLGDLLPKLKEAEVLALFDRFRRGEQLVMEHYDWLFEVSKA